MGTLVNDANSSASYSELSRQFKEIYPTVVHAYRLISEMYNRLTLVDNFSHKEAITKIFNDHRELPGFSKRNIYRALPQDNPSIPRRVVPKRHKSSDTISKNTNSLSVTEKVEATESKEDVSKPCANCQPLRIKVVELEEALKKSAGPTKAENFASQIRKFTIFKERHIEVIDGMEKSVEFICVEFDKNGNLLSVLPDSYYKKFHE
jgi:hypothetical protein